MEITKVVKPVHLKGVSPNTFGSILYVAGLNWISGRVRLRIDPSPHNIIDFLSACPDNDLSISLFPSSFDHTASVQPLISLSLCVCVFGHTPDLNCTIRQTSPAPAAH